MKRLFIFNTILMFITSNVIAQSAIKLDYISKVPAFIKICGTVYTYDTTAFTKKKYILLADYQDKGYIRISGKTLALELIGTELVNKTIDVQTYKGDGYTVISSTTTIKRTTKIDYEEGTLEIIKGKNKLKIKIHGQSSCNSSKQERN